MGCCSRGGGGAGLLRLDALQADGLHRSACMKGQARRRGRGRAASSARRAWRRQRRRPQDIPTAATAATAATPFDAPRRSHATVLTMSATVQPRERSFTGLARPCGGRWRQVGGGGGLRRVDGRQGGALLVNKHSQAQPPPPSSRPPPRIRNPSPRSARLHEGSDGDSARRLLHRLVRVVAGVEVWKDADVGLACHLAAALDLLRRNHWVHCSVVLDGACTARGAAGGRGRVTAQAGPRARLAVGAGCGLVQAARAGATTARRKGSGCV